VVACKGWRVEGRVESGYVAVGLGLDRSTVSIAGAGGGRVCFVFSPFWSLRISSRGGEVSERLKVQDEINKVNRCQYLSIGRLIGVMRLLLVPSEHRHGGVWVDGRSAAARELSCRFATPR
jgi:hypothetical protein